MCRHTRTPWFIKVWLCNSRTSPVGWKSMFSTVHVEYYSFIPLTCESMTSAEHKENNVKILNWKCLTSWNCSKGYVKHRMCLWLPSNLCCVETHTQSDYTQHIDVYQREAETIHFIQIHTARTATIFTAILTQALQNDTPWTAHVWKVQSQPRL
jgi:hypothetical protein